MFQVMCFVFVFMALLEYAAVNFFFWGARAKKKKKDKAALGANLVAGNNYRTTYSSQSNGRATIVNEERKVADITSIL